MSLGRQGVQNLHTLLDVLLMKKLIILIVEKEDAKVCVQIFQEELPRFLLPQPS